MEASWRSLAFSDNAQAVMMVLVATFGLMGLWSTLARVGLLTLRGPVARNLFLGVRVAASGAEFGAHLLAIGPRGATLVSPQPLPRGAPLTLDLGVLPEFAGESPRVAAEVKSDRCLPEGDAETHVLTVSFRHLSPAEQRPLRRVIAQLARAGSAPQA